MLLRYVVVRRYFVIETSYLCSSLYYFHITCYQNMAEMEGMWLIKNVYVACNTALLLHIWYFLPILCAEEQVW